MQLEGTDQADAELLELVLHKDASAELCLAALSAALKAPRCIALKSAADIVLERFAGDATVPLRLVQALLSASEEKADPSIEDQRKSMYALLWNHATQRFTGKDYVACMDFYAAALGYAEANTKAAIAHQLAQAHLALQDLNRSMESLDIAAEHEPSSQQTSLAEGQKLLRQREAHKALDLLQPLMTCTDDSPDYLRDGVDMRAGVEEGYGLQLAGRKASSVAAAGEADSSSIADEEDDDDDDGADDEDDDDDEGDDVSSKNSLHHRLAAIFDQALDRLEAVGRDSFFGEECPAWFAKTSLRAACIAEQAKVLLPAAVLYRASGSFYGALPHPTPDDRSMQMVGYLLGAKSALKEHCKHPKCRASLGLLLELHKKASAILGAARQPDLEDLEKHRHCLADLGKSMALRLPGYGHLMVQYIERAIAHGNIPGDMMADIGYLCLIGKEKGGRRYPPSPLIPAAKAAWRAGLQLMRSQREPPCMERFAKAAQHLYVFSSEEEQLALLADIGAYVRSMESSTFPDK
ncbi:g2243 [Coccomyxa viridis]|uniref:G2243 protein n=1 Tax=Coccomyxa viridis TaxID=1274662 RepID=A0ABP1FRU8_9CHLO